MRLKLLGALFITSLILIFSLPAQSQEKNQLDYDRMLRRLNTAHEGIFKLPFDSDFIQSNILQAVYKKREELCPNYPGRDNTLPQDYEGYKSWIIKYEQEYFGYIEYLEKFLRSHRQ